MNIDSLLAVSPIDGRYSNKCSELQEIFSEFGLIKRRVLVECTWLKALAADPKIRECKLTAAQAKAVDKVAAEFSLAQAATRPSMPCMPARIVRYRFLPTAAS